MSPSPPFTWRAAVHVLGHPGPPPPALPGTAFILLVLCLATVVVLIWLGHAWHDDPHYFFRERKVGTYLSSLNLLATGAVSGLVARRLSPAPPARFWRAMSALLVWMALDDLLVLHEQIDRGIHAVLGLDPDHPVTDHLDDLIVAGYGVVAVALAWVHRAHLVAFPWMGRILVVALGLFAAMVVMDVTHASKTVEDALKVVAGTLVLVGFLAAWLDTTTTGGEG